MSQRRASLAGLGGGIRRPGGSQGDPPVEVQKDGSVGGKGTASDAEAAKAARRRQSLSMMSAGSMGGGMNAAMKDHICKQSGITDDTPPQEKMDIVLKLAMGHARRRHKQLRRLRDGAPRRCDPSWACDQRLFWWVHGSVDPVEPGLQLKMRR